MRQEQKKLKWTPVNFPKAVHPGGPDDRGSFDYLPISALPPGISDRMPGIIEAFSSALPQPFSVGSVTVTGALGVCRTEGVTTKGYPIALGITPAGGPVMVACKSLYPGHHCTSGSFDRQLLLQQVTNITEKK